MAVKGVQQVLNNFKMLEAEAQKNIKTCVEEYTIKILRTAQRLAPSAGESLKTTYGLQKNDSNIQQFIDMKMSNGGMTGTVFLEASASKLAIYIEFGTGSSAAGYVPTLPPEWQSIARQYYVNGKGTLIKQPFLLPSFFENRIQFLNAIRAELEKYGLKTVLIP